MLARRAKSLDATWRRDARACDAPSGESSSAPAASVRLEGRGRSVMKPHRASRIARAISLQRQHQSKSRVTAKARNSANEVRFPASREDGGDAKRCRQSAEAAGGRRRDAHRAGERATVGRGVGDCFPALTTQVPSSTRAAEIAMRVENGSDSKSVPSATAMIGLMYA